jgi:hypothetical protein
MSWDLRKGVVGLVSLGALLIVYLVYSQYSQTPEIGTPSEDGLQAPFLDARSDKPGRISGVEVVGVEGVTYEDRDDQGRLYRQWGFGALWHRSDDVWEMKQPWVRLLLADANCVITADWGRFTLQSGQGNAFPTDALFSGHVVLQVQPHPGSSTPACQVNLDDISFNGSTSRFTSSGQIDFVSEAVRWTGRQAEFVYNDQDRRIEYFRLGHLDALSLKVPGGRLAQGPAGTGSSPTASGRARDGAGGPSYQCILRDEVEVRTAQEVVSIDKVLWLTDLVWSGAAGRAERSPAAGSAKARPASSRPEEGTEVSVVCQGSVVVTPMGVAVAEEPSPGASQGRSARKTPPPGAGVRSPAHFGAATLRYSALSGDAQAEGPVEVDCLCKDLMAKENPGLIPVRMTAVQGGTYQAQTNRISLEGPCLCTFTRTQAGVTERGSLAAPRLIADLLDDREAQLRVSTRAVRHMRAEGGTVELRLENLPTDGKEPGVAAPVEGPVVSGARMVCTQLDVDPQSPGQVITAAGPGTIWLNNSTTQKTGRLLDSHQPFYALLSQFDTLQFFVADNRIVAFGKKQPMWVDYFPIVDGRQESHIRAEADSVKIDLVQTGGRERDLGTLAATGNVYYDDESHQLTGHRLVYDHKTQWMEITGWDNQPCTYNGLSLGGINYNIKTKDIQTRPVGPIMIK